MLTIETQATVYYTHKLNDEQERQIRDYIAVRKEDYDCVSPERAIIDAINDLLM